MCVLSSLHESIPHHGAKEKLIVFIKIRKKSNEEERMAPGVRAAGKAAAVSVCTSSLLIRRGDTKALLGDFFLRTGQYALFGIREVRRVTFVSGLVRFSK